MAKWGKAREVLKKAKTLPRTPLKYASDTAKKAKEGVVGAVKRNPKKSIGAVAAGSYLYGVNRGTKYEKWAGGNERRARSFHKTISKRKSKPGSKSYKRAGLKKDWRLLAR